MNKFKNQTNSNNKFLVTGIMTVLTLFLMSNSSLGGAMALDNSGGYTLLDCVYDNDTNKETCCDGPDDNIKCLECDVDLNTGQKFNCKEVPNKSESNKNPRLPDSVFDGNMIVKKDSMKQSQGLGKFTQIPSESK